MLKSILLYSLLIAVCIGKALPAELDHDAFPIPNTKTTDDFINDIFKTNNMNADITSVKILSNFTKGLLKFSEDLYQACIELSPNENLIISPMSIALALALISQGANGKTSEQIVNGLHFENIEQPIADEISNALESLRTDAGQTTLVIANQLYVKQGYGIQNNFRDIAINKFKSNVETIEFVQAEAAAKQINEFVANRTNNKIQNLINPSTLDENTALILVNAIYFKGVWEKKFPKENTKPDKFYIDDTNTRIVDYIETTDDFLYARFENLNADVLQMNYENSDISFVIVLPLKGTKLSILENTLKSFNTSNIINSLRPRTVFLTMPKFKIEYEIKLNDVLQKLDIIEMFGEHADFGKLLTTPFPISVSQVVHKAYIEVNEDGTEAAGASDIETFNRLGDFGDLPKIFYANRPFLFYLMDTKRDTVLFSGQFMK